MVSNDNDIAEKFRDQMFHVNQYYIHIFINFGSIFYISHFLPALAMFRMKE